MLGIVALVVLGALILGGFWYAAVSSRQDFMCPSCGEHIRSEYLTSERCNTCGAPLTPLET